MSFTFLNLNINQMSNSELTDKRVIPFIVLPDYRIDICAKRKKYSKNQI